MTSARFGVSEATAAAIPNLKVISSFGVGTETLPLTAPKAQGIAVGYTANVLNDCVADTAFGLVIDVARRRIRHGGALSQPARQSVASLRL